MTSSEPSGRFLLRIDPGLHAALRRAAEEAGSSLNEYCARKLAAPGLAVTEPAPAAVTSAARLCGGALVGIVAFGSWARGDTTAESDVDLLVVVERTLALSRSLYQRWDASPVFWEERRVEPHFVHLPETGARLTALWAEAAVDGIVLYDPGLRLSRRLAELRGRIAQGEITRRWAHGQPYWVEAA